jgi:hypothetical protein
VFVLVSASLGRDIVMHPQKIKSTKAQKVWYPCIRGSCGVHPLETFQASLKEPLGLLHRADHHTFPNCRILLKNILSFFYGCRLNVKALMDEPIVVVLLLLLIRVASS